MASKVHVDQVLTDGTVAYFRNNAAFVANKFVPPTPVKRRSDKYIVHDRNDASRRGLNLLRADGAPSVLVDANRSTDQYYCARYAAKAAIIPAERDDDDDPAGYEQGKINVANDTVLLEREMRFLAIAMTAASWASGNQWTGTNATESAGVGTSFIQFNQAGADPIRTFNRVHNLVRMGTNGYRANKMTVAPNVHTEFLSSAAILERIKYNGGPGDPAMITPQMLAAVFGVEEYLVPDATYATNAEGVTAAYADVAAGQVLMGFVSKERNAPTALRQFSWSKYDLANNPEKVSVRRWVDENADFSEMVETEIAVDFKVTNNAGAVLLSTCLG